MPHITTTRRPLARRDASARLSSLGADEFEGYASLFGVPDGAGDIVQPGAFSRTLRRRPPDKVRMLYQHSALEPLGIWEDIKEDARGLYVRGRLVLDVARAFEVRALFSEGALNGLSIGFRTLRAHKSGTYRLLTEIELWEISVVTFPLLAGSAVTAVGVADAAQHIRNATKRIARCALRDGRSAPTR